MSRLTYSLGLSVALTLSLPAESTAEGFVSSGRSLRAVYEYLHQHPELSFQEKETSAILAAEMRLLGFEVTTGLGDEWVRRRALAEAGKTEDGVGGHGVVAVFRNGAGPTVMIRADMDGLPVPERTSLPYASARRDIAWTGEESAVMHACGHDIHMTSWLGTARELVGRRREWSGTLVMILQPAEELGLGAAAMLEDGLFRRFPRPDFNLALHVNAAMPAGAIGVAPGFIMANVDTVDVIVRGVGGHGAYPHDTKDPIVVASRIVGALQTLVSRELDPQDAGVVTVGAFTAGAKHNIIPDEARLMLTVRSYSDSTRSKLLSGIERIARGEAMAAGLEGDLAPVMSVKADYTPATYNDPVLAARLTDVFRTTVGGDNVQPVTPTMGGEDFARYGRTDPPIPSVLFWLGSVDRRVYEASRAPGGAPLPSLHSSSYAPDPDPTIATGVKAMTAAAMDLFARR